MVQFRVDGVFVCALVCLGVGRWFVNIDHTVAFFVHGFALARDRLAHVCFR